MKDIESPEARLARLETLRELGPKSSDITALGNKILKVEQELDKKTNAKIDAALKTIMDQVRENARIAKDDDKRVAKDALTASENQYELAIRQVKVLISDAIEAYDHKQVQARLKRKEKLERWRSKGFSAAWSLIVLLAVVVGSQSKFVGDVLMSLNPFR